MQQIYIEDIEEPIVEKVDIKTDAEIIREDKGVKDEKAVGNEKVEESTAGPASLSTLGRDIDQLVDSGTKTIDAISSWFKSVW